MRASILALLSLTACASHAPSPTSPQTSTVRSEPSAPLVRPTVAAELAVPDANPLVLVASARGAQIYACAADASGAPAWKLHAPRADLFDASGAPLGGHFGGVDKGLAPGPYWQAADGSRVHGAKPISVPSPGSIPLLRLEAADTSGTGVLAKVAFIQRLATTGGVAPAGACTAGQTAEVPYTATYYFYTAP